LISKEVDKMYPAEIVESAQEYGFKAANLIYLQELFYQNEPSIIIPSFIAISKNDITSHLDNYAPKWRDLWKQFIVSHHGMSVINTKSEEILHKLQSVIKKAFSDNLYVMNFESQATRLMVRSSGNEDSEDIANPGGNESVLSLNNSQKISCAVGQVVASYFSFKSMGQRLKSGEKIDDKLPTLACLIQDFWGEYVHADQSNVRHIMPLVSGVIYSDFGNIHIQAAPGHGELVVNSLGYTDNYYVSRENTVFMLVREKKFRLVSELNQDTNTIELKRKDNPFYLAITACIPEKIAIKISQAARRIENTYGMRMDIEFIYNPNQHTIAIVQARPIVEASKLGNLPNALSKDYIAQHPEMPRCRGEMLTLSIMHTNIIRHKNEILVCDTINQALEKWIKDKKNIKGVIVRHYAPSTSHEVGMFNSKGIPVLQVNNINDIQLLINALERDCALILDPQNSTVFQIRAKDLDNTDGVNSIQEGLFHSILTHHVTPPKKVEKPSGTAEKLIQNLMTFLHEKKVKKYHSLHEIKEDLNQLSFISAKEDRNHKLKIHLANLVLFAYDSRRRKDGAISAELFAKIVETSALLFDKINQLQSMHDADKDRIYRIEYLNILKKFEGLFISVRKDSILSSSIFSELAQSSRDRLRQAPLGLDNNQIAYYHEFMKLSDFIAIKEKACEWATFCEDICKQGLGSKLAELVAYLVRQDIHQYWLNYYFYKVKNNMPEANNKDLLDVFFLEMEKINQNNDLINVSKQIDQMENQIGLWAFPENFEKLFGNFHQEISGIDDILCSKANNPLRNLSTFKLMDKFVDVFDRSIKSLQHGQYSMEQKALQVERFRMILAVFFEMLEKRHGDTDSMSELKKDFESFNDNNENQLDINPLFNTTQANPSSYKIPNEESIQRALLEPHTLANIHSVIHQALICYNARQFIRNAKDIIDFFPKEMQDIIQKMQKLPIFDSRNTPLVLCDFKWPEIITKFNIPLSNHAAQMFIIYNLDKKCFRIKLEGYGGYTKKMWNNFAQNTLCSSSETNALINRFDIGSQGCHFDATMTTPAECFRLFQAFSDYLPYCMLGEKIKICLEMPIDFQPLSQGVKNIFNDAETFDDVKKLYLTQKDRTDICDKIAGYSISEDKKDILRTYNGMALMKAGDIDESKAQALEKEQLQMMCSDALISVYLYRDTYLALQNPINEKNIAILTSSAARRCYQAGASFAELFDLFENNRDKFYVMTGSKALWAYASGVGFADLLLLDDNTLESVLYQLNPPNDHCRNRLIDNQAIVNDAVKEAQNRSLSDLRF
jgi:Pyruvate phosphate dikinase, AMP/ATP-binding domain